MQRNITTLKNISFVVSGKEKKQGPRVQVFFLTFVLDGVVLRFRLIGAETTPLLVCICVCVSGFGSCLYLHPPFLARCMAVLWSFYPKPIPGNAENFSQTLLVTVPRQLLLTPTDTHTYTCTHIHLFRLSLNPDTTDRHSPKSRHLALRTHIHARTHTHKHTHTPWGTSGKVGDQQKHSRETGEGRGHQMQDSTQQEGERGGGKKSETETKAKGKGQLDKQ